MVPRFSSGIGNIPNAVAAELKNKKHLGIHTEMFTETMVDLIECGAVDNSCKKACWTGTLSAPLRWEASGSMITLTTIRLYCSNPVRLQMIRIPLGGNNKFVSVNATLEIDLTGQCCV